MTTASFLPRRLARILIIALLGLPSTGMAEPRELHMAAQNGLAFLPLIVAQDRGLIEKHAKELGLPELQVVWAKISGSAGMNDALLNGGIDFAAGGLSGLAILWTKTKGGLDVRGVGTLTSMPSYLLTRNPNVRTVRDFTSSDRIALPAVKVSPTAIILQMLAAREFGEANYAKLDSLTVSMSQPDATIAMLSGRSEITAHFSTPPYQYAELKNPNIRRLISTNDIMGGPHTLGVLWTTGKFRSTNPKAYLAVYKALEEAMTIINSDKRLAAEIYLRQSREKYSVEDIKAILENPENEFSLAPRGVEKFVGFMHRIGSLPIAPKSWKDLFFEEVHGTNGS